MVNRSFGSYTCKVVGQLLTNVGQKETTMGLTQEVLNKVKESTELRTMLALEFKRSTRTIERYISDKPHKLTTPGAIKVITRYLNISKEQALTN